MYFVGSINIYNQYLSQRQRLEHHLYVEETELSRQHRAERKGGARASLMILRVGYEDHPMKVKVMVEL